MLTFMIDQESDCLLLEVMHAERNGLAVKSSHKMRKTYASNLNANGVPIEEISELLGHSNLSTTMRYLYNPLTEKETYERIKKAL